MRENSLSTKMKERRLLDILQAKLIDGPALYSPLEVDNVTFDPQFQDSTGYIRQVDALLELRWRDKRLRCAVMSKGQATPRAVRNILAHRREGVVPQNVAAEPVLLVPYLSDGIAEQLQTFGMSGIDLNGNFLILTPDLVAIRLDQPNQYPESRDIKKVYSYNSSIVGRFLLAANRAFEQVNEIYDGIQEMGGGISLSTVSKVLKSLDEDMIISKKRGEIRLLQPGKLLDRLREGYREPRLGRNYKLKLRDGEHEDVLNEILGADNWVWSGETSAEAYAATTTPRTRVAYFNELTPKLEALDMRFGDDRFYTCVLEQTDDDFVYFDRRGQRASPVETYLALSQLDKREREIARDIREKIILAEFEADV